MSKTLDQPTSAPTLIRGARVVLQAMRLHYWLKNLLLFLPAAVAGAITRAAVKDLCVATLAYGCTASANYLVNDFFDRKSDSEDDNKKCRPLVAGSLTRTATILLVAFLVTVAVVAAASLPIAFGWMLAAYLCIGLLYTLILKPVPIVDIMALVALYDLRVLSGAAAISLPYSPALLLASSACFASLALIKRVAQVSHLERVPSAKLRLAYKPGQRSMLYVAAAMGIAVFALVSLGLFGSSAVLPERRMACLLILILLCAWLCRCLALAARGKLREDLVAFILTDVFSLISIVLVIGAWIVGV